MGLILLMTIIHSIKLNHQDLHDFDVTTNGDTKPKDGTEDETFPS
jgi:hypothetical protein